MVYRGEERVGITLGTVDVGSVVGWEARDRIRPSAHIFVGEKAFWDEMARDGLPAHDRFSDGRG